MKVNLLVLFIILSISLPHLLIAQESKSGDWQEVIMTSPRPNDNELKKYISKKRPVISRDMQIMKIFDSLKNKPAIIAFKVCINKKGGVSYVEIDEFRSSVSNKDILRKSMESIGCYKFKSSTSAPEEECGTFDIIVK